MKFLVPEALQAEMALCKPAVALSAEVELGTARPRPGTGLKLWRLRIVEDSIVVEDAEAASKGPRSPLPGPPEGIVAIVASDASTAKLLREAWAVGKGSVQPRAIVSPSLDRASPEIADLLAAEVVAYAKRCAEGHRALTIVRSELEQTREVLADTSRLLSSRSPSPVRLAASVAPSENKARMSVSAGSTLLQDLGVVVDNVCRIAIHIGDTGISKTARLLVRLVAAESNTILGSWLCPSADIAAGWLDLDLPSPLPTLRQTACLELVYEDETNSKLPLSIARRGNADLSALQLNQTDVVGTSLAFKLWTADLGGRFVIATYWQWDEIGASLPLDGARLHIGVESWSKIRVEGKARLSQGPDSFPVAMLDSPGSTTFRLKVEAPIGASDVAVVLTSVGGDPKAIRAEIALEAFEPLAADASQPPLQQRRKRSQARPFNEASGVSEISLAIPLRALTSLELEICITKEHADALVNLVEISAISFGRRLPRDEVASSEAAAVEHRPAQPGLPPSIAIPPESPYSPEPVPPAVTNPVNPQPVVDLGFDSIAVNSHVKLDGYEHLDMTVSSLAYQDASWRMVRFKVAKTGDAKTADCASLEFRVHDGSPRLFAAVIDYASDSFGPVLMLKRNDIAELLTKHSDHADAKLLLAIVRRLPKLIAFAARRAGIPTEEIAIWERMCGLLDQAITEPDVKSMAAIQTAPELVAHLQAIAP